MSTELVTIQQAITQPTIRDLNETDIYKPIIVNVGRAFALKGQVVDKDDLKFIGYELMKAITQRYIFLTVQEIAIAIDKWVK